MGRGIKTTVKIRWSFAQMCCALSLVRLSMASHSICQSWARSEHVSMPKTIESPAKCEMRVLIRFLYAEGCNAAAIHRRMCMCTMKLSWVTAKCGNGAGTLKQDIQTFMMQAVGKGIECQPINISPYTLLIRRWISPALHPSVKINQITARTSYLAGDSIVLGMFKCPLRAQNWQVRCDAIDGHTRDTVQHICTKLHRIITVVSISRPIGTWKNGLRIWKLSFT